MGGAEKKMNNDNNNKSKKKRQIEILLVEDNPGDIRLLKEALKEGKIIKNLNIVNDGEEALNYLHKQGRFLNSSSPDLILLDLNLPKKDGRELLKEIKQDDLLKKIPVIILTSSTVEKDIIEAYNDHATCYIVKPYLLDEVLNLTKKIEDFWFDFSLVKLPPNEQ